MSPAALIYLIYYGCSIALAVFFVVKFVGLCRDVAEIRRLLRENAKARG